MLKTSLSLVLVAGLFAATPSLADTNADSGNSGVGRGCTLDPFNHTMRCVDFDHCTADKNGNKTCPTTTTTTRKAADAESPGGKNRDRQTDDLAVTVEQVLVSG